MSALVGALGLVVLGLVLLTADRLWREWRAHGRRHTGGLPVQCVVRVDNWVTTVVPVLGVLTAQEAQSLEESGVAHRQAVQRAAEEWPEAAAFEAWLTEGGAMGRKRTYTRAEVEAW